jgi:hypothetical protein
MPRSLRLARVRFGRQKDASGHDGLRLAAVFRSWTACLLAHVRNRILKAKCKNSPCPPNPFVNERLWKRGRGDHRPALLRSGSADLQDGSGFVRATRPSTYPEPGRSAPWSVRGMARGGRITAACPWPAALSRVARYFWRGRGRYWCHSNSPPGQSLEYPGLPGQNRKGRPQACPGGKL